MGWGASMVRVMVSRETTDKELGAHARDSAIIRLRRMTIRYWPTDDTGGDAAVRVELVTAKKPMDGDGREVTSHRNRIGRFETQDR